MKGFGGGLQQMMRQANQMQSRIKKLQEELSEREFEGTAGGGAVTVKVNGDNKVLTLQIKPEVVNADDLEMLQDLIIVATNEAIKSAKDTSQQEMAKITGGMNFPGLFLINKGSRMIRQVPSLEKLTHELSKLPGVGPKTAQRLAYHLLRSPQDNITRLREALQAVKDNIHECPECFAYTEESDLCQFCQDSGRDDGLLCVVEDPSDIWRIESSGAFKGRYHVLHGSISPLDGIHPQDLKISLS